MDGAHTILLVEDDDATRTFLADNLTADGFDMLVADCVRDGRRLLEAKFPDLAIVDVMLPDACGLDLVREVRAADGVASRVDPNTPVLILSGRGSELDRLRGFERRGAKGHHVCGRWRACSRLRQRPARGSEE
jgi:DNA-binding response OmpR family regulator